MFHIGQNLPELYIPVLLGHQMWAAPGRACTRQGGSELEVNPEGVDSPRLATDHTPCSQGESGQHFCMSTTTSNNMTIENSLELC